MPPLLSRRWRPARPRAGAILSDAADHDDRAVSGGRRDRHAGAFSLRAAARSLGQPIIIENVAGAAGSIGVGRAARAAGDGYTLSIGTLTTHALIGGLYPLAFDLVAIWSRSRSSPPSRC